VGGGSGWGGGEEEWAVSLKVVKCPVLWPQKVFIF
jgi:hypothetical protein